MILRKRAGVKSQTTIIPMILNNIRDFEAGASKRKFEEGLQEALKKEEELLERLQQLPDGKQKGRRNEANDSVIYVILSVIVNIRNTV
ncbi:hypothetical protein ACT7DA_08985 [Bacillus pacificus]